MAPANQLIEGRNERFMASRVAVPVSARYMRLTTAKKNPVDQPHIRMPVSDSIPPTSFDSIGLFFVVRARLIAAGT
jgi:hypothetical protein